MKLSDEQLQKASNEFIVDQYKAGICSFLTEKIERYEKELLSRLARGEKAIQLLDRLNQG